MKNKIVSFMLRYQRWVFVVVFVFLLGVIGAPLVMRFLDRRVKYNWDSYKTTGNPDSEDPFGAYYVDEYLQNTWKGKVEVDSTFSQALKKHKNKRCNYLIYDVESDFITEEDSAKIYYNSLENGSNFIFTNDTYNIGICSGVHSFNETPYFYISDFNADNSDLKKILFGFPKSSGGELTDTCRVWNNMIEYYMLYNPKSTKSEDYARYWDIDIPVGDRDKLVTDTADNCVVMYVEIGKGKVTIDGTKFLFNNYAISQPDVWKLSEKVMNKTFDKSLPLVIVYNQSRYETESSTIGGESVFKVFLENPSTALAIQILLLMLLLWILMNSRRKRCAEEVLEREHNSSVSYVEHLATLYTMNTDYKELLVLEQRKLLYQFRKEFRFDIRTIDYALPSEYASIVAESKGYDERKVKAALLQLEALTGEEGSVSRDSYSQCMKALISALRN